MDMISKAFEKLEKKGTLVYLEDLSQEDRDLIEEGGDSYYLPWDISFKDDSVSTPARPTFDSSATTSSGFSLNSLLAVGIPDLAVLLKILLEWTMGPEAMAGDISQFYCSVLLKKCHWKYQRIIIREGLKINGRIKEAVITKLIFGVSSSSSQCEEAVKDQAERNKESNAAVSKLSLIHI